MEITANIEGKGLAQIEIRDRTIISVSMLGPICLDNSFISPGLIDIQINGFAGINFSDAELSADKVITVLPAEWHGLTANFRAAVAASAVRHCDRRPTLLDRRCARTARVCSAPCSIG